MMTRLLIAPGRTAGQLATFAVFLVAVVAPVSAQTRKVVLVHGGASSGATWQAGQSFFQSQIPGLPPVQRPNISQSVSLSAQGILLRDSVLHNMPANQYVLVGHSNGGLMSRHAASALSPLGIVTVGTGHAGVPIATQVPAIIQTLQLNTFFLADVLLLTSYPLAFGYTGMSPVFYAQAAAVTAAVAAEIAYVHGLSVLEGFGPYLADNAPGSTFIQQLPASGPQRYSLSVTDASGAAPWSLALSPSAAQNAMYMAYAAAFTLYWSADALYQYLDWSVPDAMWAYMYIGSATSLANLLLYLPEHWCVLVGGGVCLPSDGFVPSGNQAFPGGTNEAFSGPAHTRQTADGEVLNRMSVRLRSILGL